MGIETWMRVSLTLPSLPTRACTTTLPSTLASRAMSGVWGLTLVTASGSASTVTYSPNFASSSSVGGATTMLSLSPDTPGVMAAISSCEAMVCSGGASASGTGTATPTVGGATGIATCTWGGG